jgi:hypothetical protein
LHSKGDGAIEVEARAKSKHGRVDDSGNLMLLLGDDDEIVMLGKLRTSA